MSNLIAERPKTKASVLAAFGRRARFQIKQNVQYVLRDKDGNVKPIFVPRQWVIWAIKQGILSPLHPKNWLFGGWQKSFTLSNLITNAGFAGVASRINGSGGEAAFTYIAIGIGATAANVADTTLGSEITTNGGQRAAATASRITTDVMDDMA